MLGESTVSLGYTYRKPDMPDTAENVLRASEMPCNAVNFEKPLFYPVVSGLSVRLQTTRRPILPKRNFTKLFKIESYDNTT